MNERDVLVFMNVNTVHSYGDICANIMIVTDRNAHGNRIGESILDRNSSAKCYNYCVFFLGNDERL